MFGKLSVENLKILWRGRRYRATRIDRRHESIFTSLVRDQSFGIMTFHQCLAVVDVGLLARRQDELQRVPKPVDRDVQLGPEPAPRASPRLVGAPFFTALAACWWARITVLSWIIHCRSGVLQLLEDPRPDALGGPAIVASPD